MAAPQLDLRCSYISQCNTRTADTVERVRAYCIGVHRNCAEQAVEWTQRKWCCNDATTVTAPGGEGCRASWSRVSVRAMQ